MELPISCYGYYLQNVATIFPLNIYLDNNKVFILDNFSADSSIKAGDEIVSINEKSIEVILEDLYKYVNGENNYAKNIVIESLTFPGLFWVINDEYKNFIIGILRKDKEIKIEIPSIPAGEFEAKMAGEKPISDQTRAFYYVDDIAYLRPGQFYNAPKDGNLQINSDQYKYQPRKDSFGILIGEQTAPLMSANDRQFKLPNTQLTITFPEAYYGDSLMVNGVIPEYMVHDAILTEKDEILDYTLKLIKEKYNSLYDL